LVLCIALAPRAISAQESVESTEPVDTEAIIEQILELQEQLESLLSALPADLREQVERQWQTRLETRKRAQARVPEGQSDLETEAAQVPLTAPPVGQESVAVPSGPADSSVFDLEEVSTSAGGLEPIESMESSKVVEPEAKDSLACVHMAAFDTNADRIVSPGDRYWRYLRLWTDNGDGIVDEELEIDSLFELDIREIRVELDYYGLRGDVSGDIRVGDQVQLVLIDPRRNSSAPATLVVQAGRMARGGYIWLADSSGQVLDGYQAVSPAIVAETDDGRRLPLVCQ
jgi:hypothetical protein